MFKLFSRKRKDSSTRGDIAPSVTKSLLDSFRYPGAAQDFAGQRIDLRTYDEMQCDPLVRSALQVKKLGTLAVDWRLESANESPEATTRLQFIRYVFSEMQSEILGVLFDALDALAKGFSVQEIVFVHDGREFEGMLRIHAIKAKNPEFFGFDVDEFLNIRSLTLHVPGEPVKELPISKFIVFAHNQQYGQPAGESDLRSAYRHWRIKRELITQWTAHLEKFASPTVMGKFRRGTPPEDQNALLNALDKLQRQSAVVYPDDIEVGLLDGQRLGETGYLEAIDYHNREIARAILGQTLTTEDSRRMGSLALGKVHLQVLIMQLAGLRRNLAERVVNEQIIRPLIDINFGAGHYPRFVFDEPELDVFRTGRVV